MNPDPYWVASPAVGAILQAELLSNLIEFRVKIETIGNPGQEFEEFVHPLVMVMSQDCDLDLDYKARYLGGPGHRQIDSVLLCEADDAVAMKDRGERIDSKRWGLVKSNQNERYHVLEPVPVGIAEPQAAAIAESPGSAMGKTESAPRRWWGWLASLWLSGEPARIQASPGKSDPVPLDPNYRGPLGLDFRRVFTMPMLELYRRIEIGEARRHCYLSPVYRDHLSNRFYGYHMRVALEETEE